MKNRGLIIFHPIIWEEIGKPAISSVHKALLLPDDYEVIGVEEYDHEVRVFVLSEAIPDSLEMVRLYTYYTVTYTPVGDEVKKEVHFDHMEFYMPVGSSGQNA